MKSTVTIDAYYHKKPGSKLQIEYIEHFVWVDGVMEYQRKSTPKKWYSSKEPLRMFELWLLDEKPKCSGNTSRDRRDCIYFFRHRGFKGFNFKQKFLNIFCKKFLLRNKTAV